MINIVNVNIHCDDESRITAIDIKLKARPEETVNENSQNLIARISATFNSLSLFSEYGKHFGMKLNPKRQNIANLKISLWKNQLNFENIGKFLDAFKESLITSPF